MAVVIGTELHVKLYNFFYHKVYVCVCVCVSILVLLSKMYSEICRIIDVQADILKFKMAARYHIGTSFI